MTLLREHGDIVFVCDTCGQLLGTGTSDFGSALNLLRREQWRAFKEDEDDGDGDWRHKCDECRLR